MSLSDCPHRRVLGKFLRCELLAQNGMFLAPGPEQRGFPCPECQSDWINGNPPCCAGDNPVLVQLTIGIARPQPQPSPNTETAAPTLLQKATSFAGALFQWAVGDKFAITQQEVYDRRMAICRSCERFNHEKQTCLLCGCNMRIKVGIPTMSCPDTPPKWRSVDLAIAKAPSVDLDG